MGCRAPKSYETVDILLDLVDFEVSDVEIHLYFHLRSGS